MPPETLPYLTAELPGIGGVLKQVSEDFVVEEIPAYQPAGSGEHLFLWVEKRDTSAERLIAHLSRVLNVPRSEIGMAGLKDQKAVTRQFVSVPARCEEIIERAGTENIRILSAARHQNKLKTAHLRGNRFSLLVREVMDDALVHADRIADRMRAVGFPNYFGDQRFGREGETLALGLALLRGEKTPRDLAPARRKFLLRLSLSAVQSDLFNRALAQRLSEGWIEKVFAGDVMQVVASGGLFIVEDPQLEQQRFQAGETVTTGPLFGPKMRQPAGEIALREAGLLEQTGLSPDHFRTFAKLTTGTRRAYLVRPADLEIRKDPAGLRIEVTLPPGVYATTLFREFQKV